MTQHQIGYDVSNECGQEALLNHLQNAFKVDSETHQRVLEETRNLEVRMSPKKKIVKSTNGRHCQLEKYACNSHSRRRCTWTSKWSRPRNSCRKTPMGRVIPSVPFTSSQHQREGTTLPWKRPPFVQCGRSTSNCEFKLSIKRDTFVNTNKTYKGVIGSVLNIFSMLLDY